MFEFLYKKNLNEIIITKEDIINKNLCLERFLDSLKDYYFNGFSMPYIIKDNKRYVVWCKNTRNILVVDIDDFMYILHKFTNCLFIFKFTENKININFVYSENNIIK